MHINKASIPINIVYNKLGKAYKSTVITTFNIGAIISYLPILVSVSIVNKFQNYLY